MDTRSKKSNSGIITKIIAVILCVFCVAGCTHQVITSLLAYDQANLSDCNFHDVLVYGGKRLDNKDITETQTFRSHFQSYVSNLSEMIGRYSDGSEEAYNEWRTSLDRNTEEQKKRSKQNLISRVVSDDFITYLDLAEDGTVVSLGFLEAAEFSGDENGCDEGSLEGDADYYDLCKNGISFYNLKTVPEDVQKKADELGADGVIEINDYYKIHSWDYDADEEIIRTTYQPGYYAFKVNDDVLWDRLYKHDILQGDYYGSYREFKASYISRADFIAERYSTGRYYMEDGHGAVFTNVEGLSEKSSVKEIQKAFEDMGFYCIENRDRELYLPDGKLFSMSPFYSEYEGAVYEGTTYTVAVAHTTTLPYDVSPTVTPVEPTNADGAQMTTVVEVTEPETTRIPLMTADSTPFVDEYSENWTCYIGVDMKTEDFANEDRFRTSAAQIEKAKEIVFDCAFTGGITVLLFIACFVYLIVRAGRSKHSDGVQLMKVDRMFTDWRIALDCALGWVAFGLFVVAIEWFDYDRMDERLFALAVSVIAGAASLVVLDLVLFIARSIKARAFLKRLFPVWLAIKAYRFWKEKIKPVADEKFLYTKKFEKGILIRIGIVVGANLVLGFISFLELGFHDTFFVYILWFIFDVLVVIESIRFVGGMYKIFSALDEIRQGNYGVQINLPSLPPILRETAVKVMNLRDGLKFAVDEAVKQEQTKTELITNVSHDLKTPLTSIINYVELLKKCEINDENAKEYLGVLGEKSDRLKKLIEDLVEASKASTGNVKVDFVDVSLNEMVNQLLGEHADGLEKRKLNVIADIPERELVVRADGKLLYRVMENLIVNVEKYSLYGTRVYVTVKEEGGYGTVTFKNISEQPLNISAEQLKERFVRGDESRSTEGNGLGLSIAQSLCTVQGGELEITINGDLFTAVIRLSK